MTTEEPTRSLSGLSEGNDRRTREIALSHAVTVASQQQVQKYSGGVIVNIAKAFEDYLNGNYDGNYSGE